MDNSARDNSAHGYNIEALSLVIERESYVHKPNNYTNKMPHG